MKNLLIILLFVSIVANVILGLRLYLHKCDCPEIQAVDTFIPSDTLEPVRVEPIFNPDFDSLYNDQQGKYAPPTPKKKPSIVNRVTGKHNYHKVKKGEWLYQIARDYGVTYDFLMSVNKIKDPNNVRPGTWIYVGTKEEREKWLSHNSIDADSLYTYTKRYGDSLNYADVYTESYGRLRNQSVRLHFQEQKSLKFGLGVGISTNYPAPFKVKGGYYNDGVFYTLDVGIGKQPTVGVGLIKMIK